MTGGYHKVTPKELASLQNDEVFIKALEVAKQGFASEENGKLGKLVSVQTQIVSGVNYKMVFESNIGEYQIIVYCQPWTNTYQVTSIEPVNIIQ